MIVAAFGRASSPPGPQVASPPADLSHPPSRARQVIEVEVLGQKLLLPGPLARSRQFIVTYLDEEVLVIRDQSGTPDVLVRKDKFGGRPLSEEPSFSDDDASPGV